jgi:peroxiredoxin
MKKKNFIVIIFLALLGTLLGYLWLTPSGLTSAPQVRFTDLKGNSFNLSELKGKPVIINFWATTCPGCVIEIPSLVQLHQQYSARGLTLIGVAMDYDPEAQVREMVRQKQMNYTIVTDSNGQIAKAFNNVSLTPTTFFINKEGKIIRHKLGEMSHDDLETTIQGMLL